MKNLVKYLLALAVLGSFLAYLFIGKSQAQFSIAPPTSTNKLYMSESEEVEPEPAPIPVELDEYVIFDLVNEERSTLKLKKLRFDPSLCEYAESRVQQIQRGFSHDGFKRTSAEYLKEMRLSYISENLSSYYVTESDTVNAWMGSTGHREAIAERIYTDTCVRCDGLFCVQIFASK